MDFLKELNDKQLVAANQLKGPLLILAGAGSGKTKTIIYRIANILNKNLAKPYEILALTFTNKAAGEMRERISLLGIYGSEQILMGTFHSVCARMLRIHSNALDFTSNFSIYDEDDSKKLIKEILEELNLTSKEIAPNAIKSFISKAKENLIPPKEFKVINSEDYLMSKVAPIYEAYQERLKKNNAMDFDDLLYNMVLLLKNNPEILKIYQNRFKYILVDEYQDTNHCQYILIKMLSEGYRNLCVCGDDDQSIYAWRGADIRNILEFEKDFPDAKIVKLEQNYRCTKNILSAANEVIKNNDGRKDKTLWTQNEDGEKLTLTTNERDFDEAVYIAKEIQNLHSLGYSNNEIAILYRTNAQSRILEEGLLRRGIPYKIVGGVKFYDRMEVKDVLAYLRLLVNPKDDISFTRIINLPKRGIGLSSIEKIREYANFKNLSMFEVVKNPSDIVTLSKSLIEKLENFNIIFNSLEKSLKEDSLDELVKKAIKESGYEMMLKEGKIENWESRLENLEELINASFDFVNTSDDPSLEAFLENASLVSNADYSESEMGSVLLMTLHNAKGLEFKVVFIPGMEENLFPLAKANEDITQIEEERRLCYVGMTRAMKKLYLTYCQSRKVYGRFEYRLPSRFIEEIPSELILSNEKARPVRASAYVSEDLTSFYDKAIKPTKEALKKQATDTSSIKEGDKIEHSAWGIGTIITIIGAGEDATITAAFPGIGIKKFVAGFATFKKVL